MGVGVVGGWVIWWEGGWGGCVLEVDGGWGCGGSIRWRGGCEIALWGQVVLGVPLVLLLVPLTCPCIFSQFGEKT